MTQRRRTLLEAAGFAAVALGLALIGCALLGAVFGVGVGLVAGGAPLVLAANVARR